eukprot:gene37675-45132_t
MAEMMLILDAFGEKTPIQAPVDFTVAELKQLIQIQMGIPAEQVTLALPTGAGDGSRLQTFLADGDEVTVTVRDAAAPEEEEAEGEPRPP